MSLYFKEENAVEVRGHADVVVIGGGPSGVTAALAAARHGVKVLLIEKSIILGGMATAGHVCLFEPLCDGKGRQVTSGLAEELFYRSIEYSYNTLPSRWERGHRVARNPQIYKDLEGFELESLPAEERGRYSTLFNIPAFILAMEESLIYNGVEILYDTLFCRAVMEEDTCKGVVVENASGRYAISCNMLIDSTGSAAVFHNVGAKCNVGKNNLSIEFLDTDFDLMKDAMESNAMRKAIHWRVLGWSPLDAPDDRECYQGDTAEHINEYVKLTHKVSLDFLKKNQRPDYAILSYPTMPQIRFIRQIEGLDTMRSENVFKRLEDSIGCVSDWRKSGPVHEVPYTCMLSPFSRNMAAVGRNISADADMWDVMRCYPGAMTTGQAAGTAAALALHNKTDFVGLDIGVLQKALENDGVILHL